MIDEDAARGIVRRDLRHAEDRGGVRCVLVGETLDYGEWWVQGYQSEAFAVHGDVLQALAGNGPYVVPKNGDPVFRLSSAEPVDVQMARLAARYENRGRAMTDPREPDLTAEEAEQIALRFLARSTEDDGIPRAILGPAVEAGANWVFFYQGRGYLERGDLAEMLMGNMPIVVPRDRSSPYALSPLEDVDLQIQRLATSR